MVATNIVNDVLNDSPWKPKLGTEFDSEQEAYDFYNAYRGKVGFGIKRHTCGKIRIHVE